MLLVQIGGVRAVLVGQSLLTSKRQTGTKVLEKDDCQLQIPLKNVPES